MSEYPTTQHAMMAVLHNEELAEQFLEDGAPIAVRIRLQSDNNTKSGFSWTSSAGPNQQITPGTTVAAQITVHKQVPVSLLIPAFKKLSGLDK